MAPSNKAWIRSRMAGIRKVSGIAFSEDIFLSILICLIAKNKHLVIHSQPDFVSELKTVTEQHCAVVYGLTTATIVCHRQQTRQDIIGAITGRHSDIVSHTVSSSTAHHYQFPSTNTVTGGGGGVTASLGGGGSLTAQNSTLGQSQVYYQYSNPGDDFLQQRHAMMRYEKSRRSVATTHSEMSEYSLRPSEKYAHSIRTMNGGRGDQRSVEDMASLHHAHRHSSISASIIDPDDQDSVFKRSESRARSIRDREDATSLYHQYRSSLAVHQDTYPMENLHSQQSSVSQRRLLHHGPGSGGAMLHAGGSTAQVTPMDFTFPRRRHESASLQGTYNAGNEPSGVTYSGRRLAQAVILDGLENASEEVYAILQEMIVTKEINDRNRYLLPDLIIIAVFHTPKVPSNIPKQLLDHFAINYRYELPVAIPKVLPPPRKHAIFRRTDLDELTKRMRRVTVSNDMLRYIRDVVVGIRTHVDVDGGLTPRASQDLVTVVKTLAAIFQTSFVTPDLLIIATEKVMSHRLELKADKRAAQMSHLAYRQGGTAGKGGGHGGSLYTESGASSATSLPRSHPRARSPSDRYHRATPSSNHPYGLYDPQTGTSTRRPRVSRSSKGAAVQSHTSLEADDEDTDEEDNRSFIEKSDDTESLKNFVEMSPSEDEAKEFVDVDEAVHVKNRRESRRSQHYPYAHQQHQRHPQQHGEYPHLRDHQHHHDILPSRSPYSGYGDPRLDHDNAPSGNATEYYEMHKTAAEIIREVLDAVYPPI